MTPKGVGSLLGSQQQLAVSLNNLGVTSCASPGSIVDLYIRPLKASSVDLEDYPDILCAYQADLDAQNCGGHDTGRTGV